MTTDLLARPGAIALVGSGEYTSAMNEVDRTLLDSTGARSPHVVLLPTASGTEPGMPQWWNDRGVAHFTALGARVTPLLLTERAHAFDPELVAAISSATLIYVSGGKPVYVVETLRDTPAWLAIVERHRDGAVLAGCSAGAMLLGGWTVNVRLVVGGQVPDWVPALGVVPHVATIPHFDRMAGFVGADRMRALFANVPAGTTLLGVNEDTAVVRFGDQWRVLGRQTASIIAADGALRTFAAGETMELGVGG